MLCKKCKVPPSLSPRQLLLLHNCKIRSFLSYIREKFEKIREKFGKKL